jgi:toxoflavin synthase
MKKNINTEFNRVSAEYSDLTMTDPSKIFVQQPESLRLLGNIKGKNVLDIGCANGTLTRMLAQRKAIVEAFDPSGEEIAEAKRIESVERLGIKYYVSNRPEENREDYFDLALATMVLPCVTIYSDLEQIFKIAFGALKPGGKFVAITINPYYKRFGRIAYNRRFSKFDDGSNRTEFFSNGKLKMCITDVLFHSSGDYKNASEAAGFHKLEWRKLRIDPDGIKKLGSDYWKNFESDCPYIGIICYK